MSRGNAATKRNEPSFRIWNPLVFFLLMVLCFVEASLSAQQYVEISGDIATTTFLSDATNNSETVRHTTIPFSCVLPVGKPKGSKGG